MRLSALVRRPVDPDPEITGVTADSRLVRPGFLFAALAGAKADGRGFIADAIAAGAVAVLTDEEIDGLAIPVVSACDPRHAYALAAAAFWGAQPQTCVAVTGTNGKTSVVTFCRQIFTRLGRSAASMGTVGVLAGEEQVTPPGLTSLDAADTARLLAELAGRGVTHLALEASSHGIHQRRLDGVRVAAAGFTNLTHDHLDYHGTMEAYRAAKLRLFQALLPPWRDRRAERRLRRLPRLRRRRHPGGPDRAFGRRTGPEPAPGRPRSHAGRPASQHRRERTDLCGVHLPLVGAYQASNALVAAGLCIATGEDVGQVLAALEHIEGAPGRLQRVGAGPNGGEAFVDYAHTPDGLETVLGALRPHVRGRLIVVFGAGGDRDRGKRPLMGEIAARLADLVIVTDDNPRTEEPASIRAAILAAAPAARETGDWRAAIAAAVAELTDGDILVVAGKGVTKSRANWSARRCCPSTTSLRLQRRSARRRPMVEPLWTSEEIIHAVGGRGSGPSFVATGISIDTRTLEPGDLFVALAGERDGHEFVGQAQGEGRGRRLVSGPSITGSQVTWSRTPRPPWSVWASSRARARASGGRKARAVTGSVGKTSATQAIAAGLARAGRAHASVKSYNNHIGVPLTRWPGCRAGRSGPIFEIGMNHARRDQPAGPGWPRRARSLITTVGPRPYREFPGRRDRRRPRQGGDLRGPASRWDGGVERR